MDSLREIEGIGENRNILLALSAQLKSAIGVLPFVGAGLSIPFGFKGWQEFLLSQAKLADIEEKIKERIEQGEYEEAAEDLLNVRGRAAFHDTLGYEYDDRKLDGHRLQGAVTFLPLLAKGPVVTTNFDRVLERAFEGAALRFEEIGSGNKVGRGVEALQSNGRYLLKLHGDLKDEEDRVLTLTEYEKSYGAVEPTQIDFTKPLPRLLQLFLTNRPAFFIGCSLKQDRVVRLLRHVAKTYKEVRHYAIVEHPDGKGNLVKAQYYLSDHGVRPIWYPKGEHQFVELILKVLSERLSEQSQKKSTKVKQFQKATEALALQVQQQPRIANLSFVCYK